MVGDKEVLVEGEEEEGVDVRRDLRLVFSIIVIFFMVAPVFSPLVQVLGAGVEYNSVDVWIPDELKNRLMIYNVPLNVSSPGIVTEGNLYVLDQLGQPYYSFLFSSIPPVASVIDPASNIRLWSFIYGGTNPYSNYIASPDTMPIYAVYDDFDYDSGMWVLNKSEISGSSLNILRGGYAVLNTSYTGSVSMWILRIAGQSSYLIKLRNDMDKPYTGWVAFRLDNTNFNAWGDLKDPSKILFVSESNQPLPYMVLGYDFNKPYMDMAVFINNIGSGDTRIIYMLFDKSEGKDYQVDPSSLTRIVEYTFTTQGGDALEYNITLTSHSVKLTRNYTSDNNTHLLGLPPNTYVIAIVNNTTIYTNKTSGEQDHTIPESTLPPNTNTTIYVITPYTTTFTTAVIRSPPTTTTTKTTINLNTPNTQTTTLTQNNVWLGGNTTLAIKMWDWQFDGQDDYVEFSGFLVNYYNNLTVLFCLRPTGVEYNAYPSFINVYETSGSRLRIYQDSGSSMWQSTPGRFMGLGYKIENIIGSKICITSGHWDINGLWYSIAYKWLNNNYDGIVKWGASNTTLNVTTLRIYQNSIISPGNIGYVILYDRGVEQTESETIHFNHMVDKPVLFTDPSFFNGTHYLDLLNDSIVGVPYGGVQRVPSESKWLWVVYNATQDNLVHFRFLPVGSSVVVRDGVSGRVVVQFVVPDWLGNLVGLAEDIPVFLESGNYTVSVSVPDNIGGLGVVSGSGSINTMYLTDEGGYLWWETSTLGLYLPVGFTLPYKMTTAVASSVYQTTSEPTINPLFQHREDLGSQYISYTQTLNLTRYNVLSQQNVSTYLVLNQTNVTLPDPNAVPDRMLVFTIKENSGSTLYNYTMRVVLDQNNFTDWSLTDGSDVYFTDENGDPIGYWVKKWDSTNKYAELYFMVPVLPGNSETKIIMHYGTGTNKYPSYNSPWKAFIVYDEFEDGDIAEWSGDTTYYSVTTNSLFGTYSLQLPTTSAGKLLYSGIKAVNVTVKSYFKLTDASTYSFAIACRIDPSTSEFYIASLSAGWWRIIRVSGTTYTVLAYVSYTPTTTDTYMAELTCNGTSLTANLYTYNPSTKTLTQVASLTATDNTITASGYTGYYNPYYYANAIADNITATTYTQTPPTITNTQQQIQKLGTTLAPHLYDWYFDDDQVIGGSGEYVIFDGLSATYSTGFEVELKTKILGGTYDGWDFLFLSGSAFLYIYQNSPGWNVRVTNGTDTTFLNPDAGSYNLNEWTTFIIGITDNNGSQRVYGKILETGYSKTLDTSITFPWNNQYTISNLRIERTDSLHHLYLQYVTLKTDNKTTFIADPTFFNGTHYIDLSTGAIGTPYNDVQRVPAEQKWLWVVYNSTVDSLVHVRFVPNGSVVVLRDRVTGQEWNYTVTGTPNSIGLIEDYTITPPTTNPVDITIYIPKQTTIAPHLYDWKFDGQDDYVDFRELKNWIRYTMTMESMFYLSGYSTSQAHSFIIRPIYGTSGNPYMYIAVHWYEKQIQFFVYNGSSSVSLGKNGILQSNRWFFVQGVYNNGLEELWINNTRYVSSSAVVITSETTDYGLLLGYKGWWATDNYFFNGKIAYVKISNENTTMINKNIINKPISLLDASFFNGTVYFDLVNSSVIGTPYNGVQRIPAESKWLWVVMGDFGGSGYLSVRFVPNGTVVVINDTVTGESWSYTITGTPNSAGLIEEYKIKLPTLNPINITVKTPRKQTIAPHLYDWSFDGVNDYIEIPSNTELDNLQIMTILSRIFPTSTVMETIICKHNIVPDSAFTFRVESSRLKLWAYDGSAWNYVQSNTIFGTNKWYNVGASIDANNKTYIYVDNAIDNTGTINPPQSTSNVPIRIGKGNLVNNEYFNGLISYVTLYNQNLTAQRINNTQNNHIVKTEGILLFMDASFFNGTHYFNLVNDSIVGTPYGGVARVPADGVWVWSVVGVQGDGLLHFRFFPDGTVVDFGSGYRVVVSGTPNSAGLIEDFAVEPPFESGVFNVTFYFPVDKTYGSSDTGARDGSASILHIGSGQVLDAGLINTVSNYTFTNPRKTLSNATFSLELRFKPEVLGGVWNVSVPEYLTTAVITNGTITLDVNGTTGTGTYVFDPSKYYIMDIVFGSGWTAVALAESDYSVGLAGYDSLNTIVNITAVGTTSTPDTISIMQEINNTTILVDWYRVRLYPVVTGSVLSGIPYAGYGVKAYPTYTYGFEYNGTDAGGVSQKHFALMLIGEKGTITVRPYYTGNSVPLFIAGAKDSNGELLSTDPTGTAGSFAVYVNDTLYTTITASDYMKLLSNLMDSTTNTSYGAITINDRTGTTVRLPDIGAIRGAVLLYRSDHTTINAQTTNGLPSSIVDSKEQVAPITYSTPGKTYSLAIIGYNGTVVDPGTNKTIPMMLVANITSKNIVLEAWKNGTLVAKGKELEYRSPMYIEIGFHFDDLKNNIVVYGMLAYTVTQGQQTYTMYDTDTISFTYTTEPSLYPFIQSKSDIAFSTDRFALTLGDGEYNRMIGKITMNILGAIPMTGLVKYISVNQPVKITNAGNDVIITYESQGTGKTGITLEGFKGWSLTLGIYGTTVSGITITTDSYPVDFPLGFTAVVVVDLSTRTISITGATPPPVVATVTPTQPTTPVFNPPTAPEPPKFEWHPDDSYWYTGMTMIMVITAIMVYRLSRDLTAGLILGGLISIILNIVFSNLAGIGVGIIIIIIGFSLRFL